MKSRSGDKARVLHIRDAIEEIQTYVEGISYYEFKDHSMMMHASINQLEIIGEAAKHISPETKEKYGEVKWREIIGLRNILVHEYFGIDSEILWNIIKNDIPDLKNHIDIMVIEFI